MLLPLAVVLAQLVAFWLLVMSRGVSVTDVPRIARLSPDFGLIIIVVTMVSLVWMLVGTIWGIRLLRRRTPA